MWKIEETKDGGILDAYKVFHGLDDPNVVACSSKLNEVVFLFFQIERRRRTHIAITQLGINLDVLNRSTLVDMYAICEDHGNMRKLRWAQHLEMLLLTWMQHVVVLRMPT